MTLLPALMPLAAALLSNAPVPTNLPRLAPAQFVSPEEAFTFRTPRGSRYCPLPSDFVGVHHGPILFLTSAGRCDGTPSPQIGVSRGMWFSEAEVPRDPCHRFGSIRVLGGNHPLCRTEEAGMIRLEARARYSRDGHGDGGRELFLLLLTTPERLNMDLATLRATAASVSICRSVVHPVYEDGKRAPTYVVGHGAACPRSGRFF